MIMDCGTFQNEETGEPLAYAKMGFFGGNASLNITPDDLHKIAPHKGRMVSIGGHLHYEIKKGSGKESIRFQISDIKPLAAGK